MVWHGVCKLKRAKALLVTVARAEADLRLVACYESERPGNAMMAGVRENGRCRATRAEYAEGRCPKSA